jgi:hypothetical protein
MTTGIDWSYAKKSRAGYVHGLATLFEACVDDTKLLDFNSMFLSRTISTSILLVTTHSISAFGRWTQTLARTLQLSDVTR